MELDKNVCKLETRYCSKDCYKREIKRFIWNYQYNLIKKEFINLMKSLYKFISLLYKYYIKDFLIVTLRISIILLVYFMFSGIIYLAETYVN